ncbi:K(+)/H(+) antiporter NhaP [Stieleria maiorica]|uniref:K(+)/H(+) antiporter NhaP n=1 Tax=Stieleria maiorica TaxID=2795974 RepID=A0A5B9MJ98_9BACT|nr:K(+)/H(+) antiporter NhaP [Stieleria maiorica]
MLLSIESLILFTGILLLLGIASNQFSTRMGVPVLFLFLVVGMLAGSEGIGGIEFENYSAANTIGTIALCLILFDGGLRTTLGAVRTAWKPAALLATLGVVVTAAITGLAASWILQITILQGLLIGSIVGSTDASAVFSILRSGGVNIRRRLADTLEVESGSNDPMAIFLTVGLIQVLTGAVPLGGGLLMLFLTQLVFGAIVGLLVGYVGVWILQHVRLGAAGLYPVLATALALLAFGLAAVLGGSGFLAVYLTGIVIGNRRPVFHRGILLFHDAAAWICQILMFMTLGLLSFPSRLLDAAGPALLISAVLILIARPIAVFALVSFFKFPKREVLFLSLVGLKGAVPITLATFPMLAGLPIAAQMFDTVFFVVLVSALIQGWPLPLVARLMKVNEAVKRPPPVTLEISTLQNVNGDIVDYYVDTGCLAAGRMIKELALPDGVVVALIVRNDEITPPQGRSRIEVGDHIVVILRPAVRAMVDRVFSHRQQTPVTLPASLEFPLRGSTKVGAIEECYDVKLGESPEMTVDELMRSRLAGQALVTGMAVPFDQIVLYIREVTEDGSIQYAGMVILPVEETPWLEKEMAMGPDTQAAANPTNSVGKNDAAEERSATGDSLEPQDADRPNEST